jgi:hypothetical protein
MSHSSLSPPSPGTSLSVSGSDQDELHGERMQRGGVDVDGEGVEREQGLGGLISFCGGRHSHDSLPLTPVSYVPAVVSAL